MLPVLGVSAYVLEGPLTSCTLDWTSKTPSSFAYVICVLLLVYVIPLSQIIYFNTNTIAIVR